MNILIINPNSDINTNKIIMDKVNMILMNIEDCKVDVLSVPEAPLLVSSYQDYHKSANKMIEFVNDDKYDAYIIACHSDPNIDLVKEITNKPVVGIGEASMKIASMLGNSFAVISPSVKSISKKIALARKYHLQDMFIGTKVSKSDEKEDLLEAARNAVEDYNTDVIILGCANYALADKFIEENLHVPIIDGVACALIMSIGLSNYWRYKNG